MHISVIIPAFNSARFLPQTLDSLLAQTLRDFEAVIVNDGSTDDTQAVIEAYCEKDPRFRGITQENAGVSAARNRGLAEAKGDYVVFLDADDTYEPNALHAFWETAQKKNADIVLGRLCNVENGKVTGFHAAADALAREEGIEPFDKRLLWNFLVCNKCYRRAFLLDHGVAFPASGFSEEGAFFMDAVYAGALITGAPDSVSRYRRHTAQEGLSVSQTASVKNLQSLAVSMEHIRASAETALQNAGKEDEAYLQEIAYKHLHILCSQFYRELWRMPEDALSLCASQILALQKRLSDAQIERICAQNADLDLKTPCRTRAQAAENPVLSVAVSKSCGEAAARTLFSQTSPLFELLLTNRAAEGLSREILDLPNVRLDAAPRAKRVLRCRKLSALEPGTLQLCLQKGLPLRVSVMRGVSLILKRRHKR